MNGRTDLRVCECGHRAFVHKDGNSDCESCNAPILQPDACRLGTCCHAFREVELCLPS